MISLAINLILFHKYLNFFSRFKLVVAFMLVHGFILFDCIGV